MDEEKKERAREATRRWRKANPEKVREGNRKAYAKNREKKVQRVVQWAKDNPEKYNARMKKWRAENRERINSQQRANRYVREYGITMETRDKMLADQGGCAICHCTEPDSRGWAVDHCHEGGQVRGILCHPCNLILGYAKDNTTVLKNAIHYLER